MQEEERIAPVSQLIPTVVGRESAPLSSLCFVPVGAIPVAKRTPLNSGPGQCK